MSNGGGVMSKFDLVVSIYGGFGVSKLVLSIANDFERNYFSFASMTSHRSALGIRT